MRRSVCVSEPSSCFAGEVRDFRFIYTSASHLPKGAKLRFDLLTQGRPVDWELPHVDAQLKGNLIWGVLPNGQEIIPICVEKEDSLGRMYEFHLTQEIKTGENFVICMGSSSRQSSHGTRAQLNAQRRRPFLLYVDPKGKGEYKEQESFHIDVRGNILDNIHIIAPSLVGKNKRFDILVRFEDQFGNLTGYAPEGSLIELSYENKRENLNWKLFVPETGFINLPNLYFNEPGVYTIQLHNLVTGKSYRSAPIKCLAEADQVLAWGLFHGESEKYDALDHIEDCLRQFRDEKGLQFYATSSFESITETSSEQWKQITHQTAVFNEEQRFNTFLGFQYCGEDGLRQVVYFKEQRPILRKKDQKSNVLSKVYKTLQPKEAMVIPSFTMAKGLENDFSTFDPELERVVEIYNAWGSSECSAAEGNRYPISNTGKEGISESKTGSVLAALKKNLRFGFVAGGLDDRGIYRGLFENGQTQYTPGLTAIVSAEQTKESLIQALLQRSCYATTGARIVLGFQIANMKMGGELTTKLKPGLVMNRHIVGYVAGTSGLSEVALIRNGTPITTFSTKQYFLDFTFDDSDPLGEVVLPASDHHPHFIFYYLRITQEDGQMAWSSPIWVDYPDFSRNGKKGKSHS